MHRIFAAIAILIIPNWAIAQRAPGGRPPTVSIGQVVDQRSDHSNRIGTIRSHMGIPICSVDSDLPVPQGGGRYRLDIVIHRVEADKLRRSEAHAEFDVALIISATGAAVYQDKAMADTMTGSVMSIDAGVFANSGDMKQQVQQTIAQAAEAVLSKPGFAAALRR